MLQPCNDKALPMATECVLAGAAALRQHQPSTSLSAGAGRGAYTSIYSEHDASVCASPCLLFFTFVLVKLCSVLLCFQGSMPTLMFVMGHGFDSDVIFCDRHIVSVTGGPACG
mmetsp:Transcript_14363/g.25084  ORF Transcript_14363/g.25084 Transcript_14363/m.25084 type:complete len:113 (-) Transcript_14363:1105-1443(-)